MKKTCDYKFPWDRSNSEKIEQIKAFYFCFIDKGGKRNTVLFLFQLVLLDVAIVFKDLNAHATPIIFNSLYVYIYVFNEKSIKFINLQGRSMLLFLLMNVVLITAKTAKK